MNAIVITTASQHRLDSRLSDGVLYVTTCCVGAEIAAENAHRSHVDRDPLHMNMRRQLSLLCCLLGDGRELRQLRRDAFTSHSQ